MAFKRTKALWRVMGEELTLGVNTLLTGRIDLASSREVSRSDPSAVLDAALALEDATADIVELNPGPRWLTDSIPSADEELPRLVPVLRKLAPKLSARISVVTANAETAVRAIGLGASIVHDLSGLAFDTKMAPALNETDAGLILGHMRGTPSQWPRLEPLTRLVDQVRTDLRASLLRAHKAGIEVRRIVLDPGLEHGKRGHENFILIRSLSELGPRGQGIHADLAGKRFLVESVRSSAAERKAAVTVAATLALEAGAHSLTVDQPDILRNAVKVVDRVYHGDEAD